MIRATARIEVGRQANDGRRKSKKEREPPSRNASHMIESRGPWFSLRDVETPSGNPNDSWMTFESRIRRRGEREAERKREREREGEREIWHELEARD